MADQQDGQSSDGSGAAPSTDPLGGANPANAQNRPRMAIRAQYVKDLSFENPNPAAALSGGASPKIDISVSVNGRPAEGGGQEVDLQITARAQRDDAVVFLLELTYGGVFQISNVPQEHMQPVVMVECPRILFPFARRIIADCTRDGGFPPLLMDPIDFVQLYLRHKQQEQGSAEPTPSN